MATIEKKPKKTDDVPIAPDGGWGWVIVLSSFLCNLIVDGIAYTFGVFLPTFVEYYNEGKGTVAWVGSLLAGVYLSCGPLVGALTNKFGCRTTCILGSVVGMMAFALSTLSESVVVLMVTYGIIGGIGFGLIYLPAIVSVGYYFEKKRALATGIAVCGSGFGTFVFAPVANALLEQFGWKGANLILAGIILNCAIFGAFMRPLELPKRTHKPLLQRMAENKAAQNENGSLNGSGYFTVQLPDGTHEKRSKALANGDHAVLANEEVGVHNPSHQASHMPTITEVQTAVALAEMAAQEAEAHGEVVQDKEEKEMKNAQIKETIEEVTSPISEPAEHDKLLENGDRKNSKTSLKNHNDNKDDVTSQGSKKDLARPLSRQDVFYTGSLVSLQKAGHQAVTTPDDNKPECPCCCCLPQNTQDKLAALMDFSLMKDPIFLFIGVSNIFGMLGFYVPFVYIIDAATTKGIEESSASLLLSIIGIVNTAGRLISGYISDFERVDSLFVTNVCIAVSGAAVFCVPFCFDYVSFCVAASVFGLFSSAFIALTSIVLVDLLGIAQLTNAFGLLCLLRGVAAIVGPPLAGSMFDMTQSYDVPFFLAGVFLFISSGVSFMVPFVRRYLKRREKCNHHNGEASEMKELKSDEATNAANV